jgi:hypothetical protein
MYVPCEVGFWDDVFTTAFRDQVKDPKAPEAVMRLREFIMLEGDNDGRLPKKYQIHHIRSYMGLRCSTRLLIKALAENHFLRRRRQTWFYPEWKKTPMGAYCKEREGNAAHKAALRAKARAKALEEVGQNGEEGTLGGRQGDVRGTGSGHSVESNTRRPPDALSEPPGAPLKGGGEAALTRWEWFKNLHWKLRDPPKCKRLLAKLTHEEWEQLQYALPLQVPRYMSRSERWRPFGDVYLEKQMFFAERKVTPSKPPTKSEAKKAAKKAAEKDPKAFARRYLDHLLADLGTGLDDRELKAHHKKQQQAKDHWEKTYGDRPWEKGSK